MYRLNGKHFFRLQTNVDRVMLFDYEKGKKKTFELALKNNSTSKQTTVLLTFSGDPDATVESPPEIHHCAIYHMSYPFKKSKKQHRDADEVWEDAKEMWKKVNKEKPNRLFYENQTARQYYLIDLVEAGELKDEDQDPNLSTKWTDEAETSDGELWPDVAAEEEPVF